MSSIDAFLYYIKKKKKRKVLQQNLFKVDFKE